MQKITPFLWFDGDAEGRAVLHEHLSELEDLGHHAL